MNTETRPVFDGPRSAGFADLRYHRAKGEPLQGKYAVVASRVPRGSRVLEIGCNTGYLSHALISAGNSVSAVELDPEAAAVARNSGIQVICGDIEDSSVLRSLGANFDVLLLMDVLEHLRDPLVALRSLRTLLRPGGRVLITGPNVAYWAVRKNLLLGRWRYEDAGIMDKTHLHFYTESTWGALVEEAGFRAIDISPAEGMVPAESVLAALGASAKLLEWLRRVSVSIAPRLFTVVYTIEAVSNE
jgi:SAM-dependent methyltransferase